MLLALALVVAVPVALQVKRGGDAKEVEIETVEMHVISPTILASGSLIYQTEIRMVSEVMGRVKELYVKEGDQVKKGDLLLRLDPATVQCAGRSAGSRAAELAAGHRAPARGLRYGRNKVAPLPAAA